jgi:hypothetical protein
MDRTLSELREAFAKSVLEAMPASERVKLAWLDSQMGNAGRMTA